MWSVRTLVSYRLPPSQLRVGHLEEEAWKSTIGKDGKLQTIVVADRPAS